MKYKYGDIVYCTGNQISNEPFPMQVLSYDKKLGNTFALIRRNILQGIMEHVSI